MKSAKPKPTFSWGAIDALREDVMKQAPPGAFTIYEYIAKYGEPYQTAVGKLARWARQGELQTGQFLAPDNRGRNRMMRMYWK